MAKKSKNKPNTINNIESVNLEIDYDKLAEAIVNAQEKAEIKDIQSEEKSIDKRPKWLILLDYIRMILINKADTKGKLLNGTFTLFLSILLKTVAIICAAFNVAVIILSVIKLTELSWNSPLFTLRNILFIICIASIVFFVFLFSVIIWGSSNEIEKEKDRVYIVSVFSGIVSLTALIISAIPLIKGVI